MNGVAVRAWNGLGLCNMWDRRCVQEAAAGLFDPDCALFAICDDKKTYSRLLMAFGACKRRQQVEMAGMPRREMAG